MSKKYVDKKISTEIHEKAAPFINWLKEAEEDDSEEDEEDHVEVRLRGITVGNFKILKSVLILKTSMSKEIECVYVC